MATGDYVTTDEYRANRRLNDSLDDAVIAPIISAASRMADAYCGRRFYLDSGVTARSFQPYNVARLYVDDFATTTGLIVNDNGTTATLNTDFVVRPTGGRAATGEAFPFYILERSYGIPWLDYGTGPTVTVTAQWGWLTVPEPVKQATIMLAADLMASRDNTFGVIGLDTGTAVRTRMNTAAAALLAPYRRGDRAPAFGFA